MQFSQGLKNSWAAKGANVILIMSLLMAPASTLIAPSEVMAASIVAESFGTGSTSTTVSGWTEGGDGAEVRSSGSGNDSASPDGGRFAVMYGESGRICKTFTTNGFTNVKLSYHWRGDDDAGSSSDNGYVEFKAGNSCSDSSGWTQLQNHDMRSDNSWTAQSAFGNNGFNNTTFSLRFRTDTSSSNEHFRVDGVTISGDAIDNAAPTFSNVPADITAEATSAAGAMVSYTKPTASDANPSNPTVTCTPASGATFAIGTTTVNCSATDAANNTGSTTFKVIVKDTTAPTIPQKADMGPIDAMGASGAVVSRSQLPQLIS